MEREADKQKVLPTIGITLGDINGIGPEVVIKALNNNRMTKHLTPVIYGSGKVVSFYRKQINANNFNFTPINNLKEIRRRKINVLNCWDESIDASPGTINEIGGKCAFMALENAVEDLKSGRIDALVTAPINKHNIQREDFKFPGHTEYLTEKANQSESLMFMVSDTCRVGVLTGHIPLKDVSTRITKEALQQKLQLMLQSLKKDFGIAKPKIAVLGLNPHAGEDGLLGNEENEVINPVINDFKEKGHLIFGSYPADGFFGSSQYLKFDAILAMYHDQGLIPFKSLVFSNGVNFTAGLPFVRTSPDHGTAYDLAGKNSADETSLRTAIFAALDITNNRKATS